MFEPLSSTITPLTNQTGYFLFVRGDRTIDLSLGSSAAANNTVLRAMGTLKTGTQPLMPVVANGFTLVGNPYASSIDFSRINKTNVPDRFFVWDPKRALTGAYVLLDADNGYAPFNSGGSYTGASSTIQSGQAFFVEGSGIAGSLGITEETKSTAQHTAFRLNDGQDEKLLINLHAINADNTTTLFDATMAKYNNLYSTNVTSEDAGKLDNIDENIAIVRNGKNLTVEKRPLIDEADTIFLKVYNVRVKNYQYEIIPTHFTNQSITAYLEDAYLSTTNRISLSVPTIIRFSVTQDAASANPHRFRIVFKTSTVLPVTITKVKAFAKGAGIQVEWDVATESNIKNYDVEKSVDGQDFEKAASVAATGNNNSSVSYTWYDKDAWSGDNFYHIKATDNNGEVKYTNIVNVKMGNAKSSISVFPNPAKSKVIYVQLNNKPKGRYLVQLFNNLGQLLLSTNIDHPNGSETRKISLDRIKSKGLFHLHITNGETVVTQQLIVE